jgi:predicted RNase H-like HicB family nuclease
VIVRYLVVIEKGRRSWGAHVPDLPGCVAVATTRAAVVKLIKGAIEFHIEGLKEAGMKVPRPHSGYEVIRVSTT